LTIVIAIPDPPVIGVAEIALLKDVKSGVKAGVSQYHAPKPVFADHVCAEATLLKKQKQAINKVKKVPLFIVLIFDDGKSSGFFINILELCSLPQEKLLFDDTPSGKRKEFME
jgi:hypothetical protein